MIRQWARALLIMLGLRPAPLAPDDLEGLRRNWEKLAEADPLWAILADPQKKGGQWELSEFLSTGGREVDARMAELSERRKPSARERALDFGCGVGRLTFALARHFQRVDGVDISESMVRQARKLNAFGERCAFHHLSAPPLPFPDASFDLVHCFLVLQHMQTSYALAYVAEFVRVLRPGGVAVFQAPSRCLLKDRTGGIADVPLTDGTARIEMHAHPRAEIEHAASRAGGRIIECAADESAGENFESLRYVVVRE